MSVLSQHLSRKPFKPIFLITSQKKEWGRGGGAGGVSEPSPVYLPADVAACAGGQCFVVNWLFHVEEAVADWSLVEHLYP